MITALLTAAGVVIAALFTFIGHWVGTRKTDTAVAQAKTATEATTRASIADQTAAAAGVAQTEAAAIRIAAVNTASTSGTAGKDALIAEMRKDGEIAP